MQDLVINIVILGLVVFLFATVARLRPENRLGLWLCGWLLLWAELFLGFWNPQQILLLHTKEFVVAATQILVVTTFTTSNMHGRLSAPIALRVGSGIASTSLLCLALAVFGPTGLLGRTLLTAAVLLRYADLLHSSQKYARHRPQRLRQLGVTLGLGFLWIMSAVWLGGPSLFIAAVLSTAFFSAGAMFWFESRPPRSIGLVTTCFGLVLWGLSFPADLLIRDLLPAFVPAPSLWNVPRFCTSIGMLLMILGEEITAAKGKADEYLLLFDRNPHPLLILDKSTLRFIDVNQAMLDKNQYTREEFLGLSISDLVAPSELPRVLEQINSNTPTQTYLSRLRRKDNSIISMEITAYNITFRGRPCRFVMGIDVSEREMLNQKLEHQARHDILTGLPNRTMFREQLTHAVSHCLRAKKKLALIFLDIYRFKRMNDTYGTQVSDNFLMLIADMLQAQLTGGDALLARIGGDEFAILIPGIEKSTCPEVILSKIIRAFEEPLILGTHKVTIRFDIGVAICPDDGTNAADLWKGAENALFQAIEAGSHEPVWFSPELSNHSEEQTELEVFMRDRLEQGAFYLAYQPIYDFRGNAHSMEALLRLSHPKYGLVSPAKFIPIAEETNLIVPIGEWVLREVCRQLRAWQQEQMKLIPVAINVSGIQLSQSGFVSRVTSILEEFKTDPRWINLEITESVAMYNMAEVTRAIKALSAAGIRFSIDDFGTGHSSLGRLDQLPISTLKIDRSFTERLCTQDATHSIVQAIIAMAKSLGMSVVAEGIEREEQIQCFEELGCDYLQGFLFSRPVKPTSIPALVSKQHSYLLGRVSRTGSLQVSSTDSANTYYI